MKFFLLIGLTYYLTSLTASAQHEADNWYFGEVVGVSFLGNTMTTLNDGRIFTDEGSAIMSDKRTGKLLFYTDGYNVYNAKHQIINNGTGFMSGTSSTQGMLIVPDPGNSYHYYLFTVPDLSSGHTPPTTKLLYSKINMQDPAGTVVFKNRVLVDNVSEKLTGTLDCSGEGYWVVTHLRNKNTFYSYHIVDTGVVVTPVISSYPDGTINHSIGYIKISPNRSQIALASETGNSTLFLFNFDVKTGEIFNKMNLGNAGTQDKYYGLSFSPDNTKLYTVAKTKIGTTVYESAVFQFESQLGDEASIVNSRVMISNRETIRAVSALQLAPNGKLYIASPYRPFLDVIHDPNLKGDACNYEADGFALSGHSLIGLPNFMDYIFNTGSIPSGCVSKPVLEKVSGCSGSEFVFAENTTATSRSWYFERGTPEVSTDSAVSVRYTDSGRYQVRLSYSTSAGIITEYRQAIVYPRPLANAGGKNVLVCFGKKTQLGVPPVAKNTYQWTPTTGLNNSTISNPIALPSKNTTYILTVTNSYGCQSTDSIHVHIDTVRAICSPDTTICIGSITQLSATGGTEYTWSPASGLSDSTSSMPFASPTNTTRYKVIVARGECRDTGYVNVNVKDSPIANAGPDLVLCKGETHILGTKQLDDYRYSWSPPTDLSYPLTSNPRVTCTNPMTYILTVISPNGCIGIDTIHVAMRTITAKAITNVEICHGDSIQLWASGGMKYNWLPSRGLDDPSSSTPIASPDSTTRYTVIVSDGNCIDTTYVTVTVYPLPIAYTGLDRTVCPGESTMLGDKPEVANTYSWYPALYLDDSTKSNPVASPQVDMDYILTVRTSVGCTAIDTVHLHVGNIIAKVSSDTDICVGKSVQLSASGGSDYRWIPGTGLDNSNSPNPVATPESTTTYTVHTSSGNCQDSAQVTVTVHQPPHAFAGDDAFVCADGSAILGESAHTGYSYYWLPTTGLNDPTSSQPIASPKVTTLYVLTVTNSMGCEAHDTTIVTIGNIKATVSHDTVLCAGNSVQLISSGGTQYQWYPKAGLSNTSIPNPIATPLVTTNYKVIASSGACVDSAFVTVTVVPHPTVDIGVDREVCKGDSIEIGTPAQAGYIYSWYPVAGLTNPTSALTMASPSLTTSYRLNVTNELGCINSDSMIVQVNLPNERSFTLLPDTINFLPGDPLLTTLHIPVDVEKWNLLIEYNPQIMMFNAVESQSAGITATLKEMNGILSIKGTGAGGELNLKFATFLPSTEQSVYPVNLTLDSAANQRCELTTTQGNTILIEDFCGKNIRIVSGTGKQYFMNIRSNTVEFGVGLSGNVRLEVFDYLGNSILIPVSGFLKDGVYSAEINVKSGLYFCRMSAGSYQEIVKIVVVQ
ncbi:MAG: hypothetical protein IPM69_16930 [Ignavibacteria bacterium]|nr:hypothetical protein [Ignavibacteria bacterium]